jgi:integrase
LTRLTESNGPVASNRARAYLSSFFAWLMGQGVADGNPTIGTNVNAERSRDRVLSEDELRAIWRGTDGSEQYFSIVRLLLLTGCRRAEIGDLQWPEIDFDKAIVSLPASRVKNARSFELPLSPPALAILHAQPRTDRGFVFGVRASGGFCAWHDGKATLDRRIGIAPWRLHDLRRSVATHMADIGVLPHVIEAVLNHQSGTRAGVAGVYNRSSYATEKRQAVERWAEHLMAIVEDRPAKVLAFTGRPQ